MMSDSEDTSSTMTPLLGGATNTRVIARRRRRDRIFGKCERQLRTFTLGNFACYSILAAVSLIVAIGAPLLIDKFVSDGIRDSVVIDSPHAGGFEQFRNKSSDGDNSLKFYFFNITNPHEVLKGGKPSVREVGPFVYRTFQYRSDFKWNRTEDTVEFRKHKYFVFDAKATWEESNQRYSTDNIQITTINVVFLGMEAQVGEDYWYLISEALWGSDYERLFTTQSIRNMIIGYDVEVDLKMFKFPIPIHFPGLYPNVTKNLDESYLHPTTMKVGAHNISQAHEIVKWKESQRLQIICPWGGSFLPLGAWCPGNFPCCRKTQKDPSAKVPIWGTKIFPNVWDADANRVHGTTGEQFWPGVSRSDTLYIFNDVLQRAIRFQSNGSETFQYEGINMIPFLPTLELFENYTTRPENWRYYNFGPDGLFNLSIVEQGASLFFSLPHFLHGSPELRDKVDGLSPSNAHHRMAIYVEPLTGQTMVEHVRAQVSAQLPGKKIWTLTSPWFANVPKDTFVPIAWFEEQSYIDSKGISDFQSLSVAAEVRMIVLMLSLLFCITFTSIVAGAIWAKQRHRTRQQELLARDVPGSVSIE